MLKISSTVANNFCLYVFEWLKSIELLYKKVCAEKTDYGYIDSMSHFSGEIISVKAFLKEGNKKISNKAREHVTWDIRHIWKFKKNVLLSIKISKFKKN